MIPLTIMILSFFLDGILTNFLPYLVNDLSYFTPMLTLVSIILIYPFYKKDERKYFITVFILGLLYDLFYTNLLFFNAVLFTLIALINKRIQKRISFNAMNLLGETILIIISYELLTGILLFTYNIVPVTIYKIFYKIIHSILLNILYVEGIYGIIKIIPKKYKQISIN